MSRETLAWLNANTLVAESALMRKAWHFDGTHPENTYGEYVPLSAVRSLISEYEPEAVDVESSVVTLSPDGVESSYGSDPTWKLMRKTGDPTTVYGMFKADAADFSYEQWLIDQVADKIDDSTVYVSSAGVLQRGAVAWIQLTMPGVEDVQGFRYHPYLLGFTSANARFLSSWTQTSVFAECDNTVQIARDKGDKVVAVKRTKTGNRKVSDGSVRDALDALFMIRDTTGEWIMRMMNTPLAPRQWDTVVDTLWPAPNAATTKRGTTDRNNLRDKINAMYTSDPRVAAWTGTALGAWQTVNTFGLWETSTKGAQRQELHLVKAFTGKHEEQGSRLTDLILSAANN